MYIKINIKIIYQLNQKFFFKQIQIDHKNIQKLQTVKTIDNT